MRLLEIQNMEYGIRNTEPGPKSSPWREDHCELVRGEIHGEPREYVFSDLYGCQWGRNPWVALRDPSVQIHMDVRFRHPSVRRVAGTRARNDKNASGEIPDLPDRVRWPVADELHENS